MGYADRVEFDILVGKTLTEVNQFNDEIYFKTSDNKVFKMFHNQDCCEYVAIEEIIGDLQDLVGNPILQAEEVSSNDPGDRIDNSYDYDEYKSETWTFYKLATIKGYVTIRWYGTSNGYYSESVQFEKVES